MSRASLRTAARSDSRAATPSAAGRCRSPQGTRTYDPAVVRPSMRSLRHRLENSRGTAQYRKSKADPLSQPRWWAWPIVSLPIALALIYITLRVAYEQRWGALALLVVWFWPICIFVSRPQYRAWKAHRRSDGSRDKH
jgi:hypothetical protein